MKKIILAAFIVVTFATFLFSKATPTQKKLAKAFPPETIGKCYSECKKTKDDNTCNGAIDELEVAVNAMYEAAKAKMLSCSDESVKKSTSIMKTACPEEEKKITKALKKLKK